MARRDFTASSKNKIRYQKFYDYDCHTTYDLLNSVKRC